MYKVYCDGSATKNRSGWGYVLIDDEQNIRISSGTEKNATNQRMELMAALESLKDWQLDCSTDQRDYEITLYSDSAYLTNCYYDKWYVNWECNNWLNAKKEPVANKDLWEQLIPFFKCPFVFIEKVKGHSGNKYNDWADKLATGKFKSTDPLTIDEKNDIINIRLSEILIDYKMNKISINKTIDKIRKVCDCE